MKLWAARQLAMVWGLWSAWNQWAPRWWPQHPLQVVLVLQEKLKGPGVKRGHVGLKGNKASNISVLFPSTRSCNQNTDRAAPCWGSCPPTCLRTGTCADLSTQPASRGLWSTHSFNVEVKDDWDLRAHAILGTQVLGMLPNLFWWDHVC